LEQKKITRQSERRRLMPTEDLTSDLNSDIDFQSSQTSFSYNSKNKPKLLNETTLNNNNNNNSSCIPGDQTLNGDFNNFDHQFDYSFQVRNKINHLFFVSIIITLFFDSSITFLN
jgi:hypothetical protein